jgi:DnaJ-class molecular chaperone
MFNIVNNNNLYDVLTLNKSATQSEIKKTYKKLALKYHPDRNMGDTKAEDKFKNISHAYSILSDPDKRKNYDIFGEEDGQDIDINPMNFSSQMDDLSEIFASMMGNVRTSPNVYVYQGFGNFGFNDVNQSSSCTQSQKQEQSIKTEHEKKQHIDLNIYHEHSISLFEAYIGGVYTHTVISDVIKIPRGINNDQEISVKSGGKQNTYGEVGDLMLKIHVEQEHNEYISRYGNHLLLNKTISLADALCCDTIQFEHLNKKTYNFKNNEIIYPNKIIVIKGMGMPICNNNNSDTNNNDDIYMKYGDLLIKFDVIFPDKLSNERKHYLKKIFPNAKKKKNNISTTQALEDAFDVNDNIVIHINKEQNNNMLNFLNKK